jgi:hypothetical protein
MAVRWDARFRLSRRARRGLRAIPPGQRGLEAVEAVQALRRGDRRLSGAPRPRDRGWTPGEQARDEAEALLRFAGDLCATSLCATSLCATSPRRAA